MKGFFVTVGIITLLLLPSCNNGSHSSSSVLSETSSESSLISSIESSESSIPSSIASSVNPLDERKQEGLLELETYFLTFNQEDYSEENWESLVSIYEAGKITIEVATSIPEILSAISNTKAYMEAVPLLPTTIEVVDVRVFDDEYLHVFVNVDINRISNLLPVNNLNSNIKELEFYAVEVINHKTSITLKATAVNLNKGEIDISMDVTAVDANISNISFTVLNGILKNLENYRIHHINDINNFIVEKEFTVDKYSQENWNQLQSYLQNGVNEINNATDYDEIINIAKETKLDIAGVEQIGFDLETFKAYAIDELTNYVNSKDKDQYHEKNWSSIQTKLSIGSLKIKVLNTQREIVEVLYTYIEEIDNIDKIYKVVVTPSSANPYNTYYIGIVIPNLEYKDTLEFSATYNDTPARIHHTFGSRDTNVQVNVAGVNLMNTSYTIVLTIIDGMTAYTCTVKVVNGVWVR